MFPGISSCKISAGRTGLAKHRSVFRATLASFNLQLNVRIPLLISSLEWCHLYYASPLHNLQLNCDTFHQQFCLHVQCSPSSKVFKMHKQVFFYRIPEGECTYSNENLEQVPPSWDTGHPLYHNTPIPFSISGTLREQ